MTVLRDGDLNLTPVVRKIKGPRSTLKLRKGKIVSYEGGLAVEFESGPVRPFACLFNYNPAVGHVVWALEDGPNFLVLGRHKVVS